jgi:hypothetical protein
MSTNGMVYPQEKPMLAGNPKDSAIAANNQAITRQADLIKATSGGKGKRHRHRRNKYGGATTGEVTVPQFQMQYTPTGATGQNPNDIIKQNAGVSTQDAANAQYDNLAKVGGSRKKRGGNSNWSWGCYSGGRKKLRSRRHTNKRKTHKKRRTTRRK